MKVARACPLISHLLFADDSLLFCKAQKEECQTILRILKEYEDVSSQLINFEKSSIKFGHKIEEFFNTGKRPCFRLRLIIPSSGF